MSQPTLNELLECYRATGRPVNAYVREPGFDKLGLYVRVGWRRCLEGRGVKTLDLANLTATSPGTGVFTCLVERLHAEGYVVYVECVTTARFAARLQRMGFQDAAPYQEGHPGFYLLPEMRMVSGSPPCSTKA